MNSPSMMHLQGRRIHLRYLLPRDVTTRYVAWMNDADVTRYLESRFTPLTRRDIEGFVRACRNDPDILLFAIVLTADGRHIGNIKMGPINRRHRFSDLGLLIGEKDCWGKGYASEAIALVTEYALGEIGLRKVTAGVYANNVGSYRAFLRAGYHHEATRHRHYLCDGVYQDGYLLARFGPSSVGTSASDSAEGSDR